MPALDLETRVGGIGDGPATAAESHVAVGALLHPA